jgi:hypothetical protein
MSEKMDAAQEVLALTGASGQVELDDGKLRDGRPLFMLQMGVSSTTSSSVFGFRPRPAVRPLMVAMAYPSIDVVAPHLAVANDVATINGALSSCR